MDEQVRLILMTKCEAIINWAEDQDWYNDNMYHDFLGLLERGENLTSNQIRVIESEHKKRVEDFY